MNRRLPELLATRLTEPLPGETLAARFGPRPPAGRYWGGAPPEARPAAVLVLLYPHQEAWYLPLTLRPKNLPDHPGQVSLPGGAVEPGESGPEAALREFHEELGGQGPRIELLGPLSPIYVHVSNFHVEPWLGVCRRRPTLTPNPSEVESVFEVPLPHLLDPANFGAHRRQSGDRSFVAPHFLWQSHRIWGATCMILGELVTIVHGL